MRIPRILRALLFSALLVAPAGARAAQVYFAYGANLSSWADVYVDGQLALRGVLPGSFTPSPLDLAGGVREVVVTPSGVAPGGQDLFRAAVGVPYAGTYTLTFASDRTGNTSELALHLTPGRGDVFCSRASRAAPLVCRPA